MKHLVICSLLIPSVGPAEAQAVSAPQKQSQEAVREELARDLAAIHEALLTWSPSPGVKGASYGAFTGNTVTFTAKGNIYSGANTSTRVLQSVDSGASFPVVDRMEGWYAVNLSESATTGPKSGWVSASNVAPVYTWRPRPVDAYSQAVQQAAALRDKYKENQYISIEGFTVEISLPPALSVNFRFKDQASTP